MNYKNFLSMLKKVKYFADFYMTNQLFCYWLQGYFEINLEAALTEKHVLLIRNSLKEITEPLGVFTQWLEQVIIFLETQQFQSKMLELFLPEIQNRLNSIFFHVIDNSYNRTISLEEAKKIHDGVLP